MNLNSVWCTYFLQIFGALSTNLVQKHTIQTFLELTTVMTCVQSDLQFQVSLILGTVFGNLLNLLFGATEKRQRWSLHFIYLIFTVFLNPRDDGLSIDLTHIRTTWSSKLWTIRWLYGDKLKYHYWKKLAIFKQQITKLKTNEYFCE